MHRANVDPPVIILGMHRSGTSMLTRALDQLGLFVGARTESHHESVFFLNLNRWLFKQAAGRWDQPEAFEYLLEDEQAVRRCAEYLTDLCESPKFAEYLGLGNYLKSVAGARPPQPWGWKDPRNTITFPVWSKVFPQAKLVYIERHGVDVAASLYRRNESSSSKWRSLHDVLHGSMLEPAFWMGHLGVNVSQRCSTLKGCFDLWNYYVSVGRKLLDEYESRSLGLKFETLLEEPDRVLGNLVDFCELTPSATTLEAIASGFDASRVLAYRNDEELRQFARKHAGQLEKFGYSASNGTES